MLVMEYVPYGDLLGYLRKTRGIDDMYYNCAEHCNQEVTSYDLLSFSQQIASGMSFLADKNVCSAISEKIRLYFSSLHPVTSLLVLTLGEGLFNPPIVSGSNFSM